jgi:preprotein translocase subunit SecY
MLRRTLLGSQIFTLIAILGSLVAAIVTVVFGGTAYLVTDRIVIERNATRKGDRLDENVVDRSWAVRSRLGRMRGNAAANRA